MNARMTEKRRAELVVEIDPRAGLIPDALPASEYGVSARAICAARKARRVLATGHTIGTDRVRVLCCTVLGVALAGVAVVAIGGWCIFG